MNLSESLGWMKTLQARHSELVTLRDTNSRTRIQKYGADNEEKILPTYDAKKLDKRVTLLAREIRLLDEAVKRTNAATPVAGFDRNDDVLGELED